jgi:hypothetical protein
LLASFTGGLGGFALAAGLPGAAAALPLAATAFGAALAGELLTAMIGSPPTNYAFSQGIVARTRAELSIRDQIPSELGFWAMIALQYCGAASLLLTRHQLQSI